MMRFTVCKDDCPYKNGMPGFVSQGYYPSSPKRPEFAFGTDLFLAFHLLHMGGPSSKQGFCTMLQKYFEIRKSPHENGCEVLEQLLDMSNHRSLQTSTTISLEHIQPGKRSDQPSQLNPIISCDSSRLLHPICSIQVTFNHLQRTLSYLGYPPANCVQFALQKSPRQRLSALMGISSSLRLEQDLKSGRVFRHRISKTRGFLMRKNLLSVLKLVKLIIAQ
jgi:hypothetical protein